MTDKMTAQEMKAHLHRHGVEVEIDFVAERLYVTAVNPYPTLGTLVSHSYIPNQQNPTGRLDLDFKKGNQCEE